MTMQPTEAWAVVLPDGNIERLVLPPNKPAINSASDLRIHRVLITEGWRPIAEAPKDGEWQVVAHFDEHCFYWWHRARWSRGAWRTGGGIVMPIYYLPLHKMPLPAPLENKS